MVRLLARTVHVLWRDEPGDATAIHPHHIDPGFGPIRDEITTRLQQGHYTPALKSDVAAVENDDPSIAQKLDRQFYPGQPPIVSYVARTVFLNTLAHGEAARGIAPDHLRFSACSPAIEPTFVEQARLRFAAESLYLDDKPGAPMRLMVEPNLEQIIRRQMRRGRRRRRPGRAERADRRPLRRPAGGKFQLVPFPAGPYQVPDEIGDGRPLLVLMAYEAVAVAPDSKGVPPDVVQVFRHKGTSLNLREYPNNLVFAVADERGRENMKERVRRRLALEALKTQGMRELAKYQQDKVFQESQQSRFHVAEAILHCYRHLFYPSKFGADGDGRADRPRGPGDRPGQRQAGRRPDSSSAGSCGTTTSCSTRATRPRPRRSSATRRR